jgi:hypothetical protein
MIRPALTRFPILVSSSLHYRVKFPVHLGRFRFSSTPTNQPDPAASSPSSAPPTSSSAASSSPTPSDLPKSSSSFRPVPGSDLLEPLYDDGNPTTFQPPKRSTKDSPIQPIESSSPPSSPHPPLGLFSSFTSHRIEDNLFLPPVEPFHHPDLIQAADHNSFKCHNPWYEEFPKYQKQSLEDSQLPFPRPLPPVYVAIGNPFFDFSRHAAIEHLTKSRRFLRVFQLFFLYFTFYFIIIHGHMENSQGGFLQGIRDEYHRFFRVLFGYPPLVFIDGAPPTEEELAEKLKKEEAEKEVEEIKRKLKLTEK